MKPNPKA